MKLAAACVVLALTGCERAMVDSRVKPLERTTFFANESSSRPNVAGTIPRVATEPAADEPRDVARGADRYRIYCAPCHGPTGEGNGPLIAHGFPTAPSFVRGHGAHHDAAYIVDTITNGVGAMPSYADRISPRDRWAIAAYVVTLGRDRGAEPHADTHDHVHDGSGSGHGDG